jgi:hypothetical protein
MRKGERECLNIIFNKFIEDKIINGEMSECERGDFEEMRREMVPELIGKNLFDLVYHVVSTENILEDIKSHENKFPYDSALNYPYLDKTSIINKYHIFEEIKHIIKIIFDENDVIHHELYDYVVIKFHSITLIVFENDTIDNDKFQHSIIVDIPVFISKYYNIVDEYLLNRYNILKIEKYNVSIENEDLLYLRLFISSSIVLTSLVVVGFIFFKSH